MDECLRGLLRAGEASAVATDRLFESEVKGVGDEGVSDGDFGEEGDGFREETEVLQAQVVTRVELKAQGAGVLGSLDEGSYSAGVVSGIA